MVRSLPEWVSRFVVHENGDFQPRRRTPGGIAPVTVIDCKSLTGNLEARTQSQMKTIFEATKPEKLATLLDAFHHVDLSTIDAGSGLLGRRDDVTTQLRNVLNGLHEDVSYMHRADYDLRKLGTVARERLRNFSKNLADTSQTVEASLKLAHDIEYDTPGLVLIDLREAEETLRMLQHVIEDVEPRHISAAAKESRTTRRKTSSNARGK